MYTYMQAKLWITERSHSLTKIVSIALGKSSPWKHICKSTCSTCRFTEGQLLEQGNLIWTMERPMSTVYVYIHVHASKTVNHRKNHMVYSDPSFFNSPWQIISLKRYKLLSVNQASNCPLQASFDFYKVNVLIYDSV